MKSLDVVTSEYQCFVCHLKSETCERSVQLPCCRQYVHRCCQMRWERHHNTCGLCREPLSGCNDTSPAPSQTNWSFDDNNAAAAAEAARTEIINHRSNVDTERIANDVLNMTREEVIQRLRELIDSPTLENQWERVREDELFITLSTYLLFYLLWYRSPYQLRKKFSSCRCLIW